MKIQSIFRFSTSKLCKRHFATVQNPYAILGVSKEDSIDVIKKKYYKLVNKYHPDKNPSPEAMKLFLNVKNSFELIKNQRGLTTKQEIIREESEFSDFKSSRPNSQQYSNDFSDFNRKWDGRDRTEFFNGINRDEYQNIRDSFENIESAKGYGFSVIDKVMPNVEKRFRLEDAKVTITSETDFSMLYYGMAMSGVAFLALMLFISKDSKKMKAFAENKSYIENKDEKRLDHRLEEEKEAKRERMYKTDQETALQDRLLELRKMQKQKSQINDAGFYKVKAYKDD